MLSVVVLFVACSASFCFFATHYEPLRGVPLPHGYWQFLRGLATGRPAALLVVVLVCANLLGDGVDAALRPASRR